MQKLKYLNRLEYLQKGSSNEEGFQIFTPEFIVNDMIKAVGLDNILNYDNTILEPASGDGAFTCRILNLRLERASQENPGIDSLRALSTIYSIEMDKELIERQRNNIYTIMTNFARKHDIKSNRYFKAVEDVILTNFYWAETNYDDNTRTLFGVEVAYCLPRKKENPAAIQFYSWEFNDDYTYRKKLEEIEV